MFINAAEHATHAEYGTIFEGNEAMMTTTVRMSARRCRVTTDGSRQQCKSWDCRCVPMILPPPAIRPRPRRRRWELPHQTRATSWVAAPRRSGALIVIAVSGRRWSVPRLHSHAPEPSAPCGPAVRQLESLDSNMAVCEWTIYMYVAVVARSGESLQSRVRWAFLFNDRVTSIVAVMKRLNYSWFGGVSK